MPNKLFRKGLVVGIIIFLVGGLVLPAINALKIVNEEIVISIGDKDQEFRNFDRYQNINAEEAWDFLTDTGNGIQIPIDVRGNSEWNNEHIDTPIPENPRHYSKILLEDPLMLEQFLTLYDGLDIILYCLSGSRSAAAAQILQNNDFNGTIYNMQGGISSWKSSGLPTISGGFLDITVEEGWEFLNDTANGIQKPIDVRTYDEWIEEHIDTPPPENASLYPLQDLQDDEKLEEFLENYTGRELVLYCRSGVRSLEAAEILVDNGFTGTTYNMLGGIIEWKNAGYPITGGEPLVADADGPYEAFEDESIQFNGSAEGGEPPYSFHWDFGNGDTSDAEDPVYTYDEPGVYQVILTVTDSAKNTATDETTATINEVPCCFEIEIPKGFGMGLKAKVTEICEESHTGVPWEFKITGGLFVIPISPLTGKTDFAAGETKDLNVLLVIGIGSIQITFIIGEYCDPVTANAFIIGPFVIVS